MKRRTETKDGFVELERSTSAKEWTCSYCRCQNTRIVWDNQKQIPSTKCRCCGSNKDRTETFHVARNRGDAQTAALDGRIVAEWNDLIQDMEQNPQKNQCDGADSLIIDSCPKMQKLFLMMKYYHIHAGKAVNDLDGTEEYRIDSMVDLLENLPNVSLPALVDIFEHVSSVHYQPEMFEYFIEGIGTCDDGLDCKILQRNRGRAQTGQFEENIDALDRHTASFFAKWHSFLFHPKFVDNGGNHEDIEFLPKMHTLPLYTSRSSTKYVDYRFGAWIDHTAHSPSCESMKDEMMENEIHPMTLDQWQSTLMKALTHLDSDKLKVDGKYTAKRTDEKYGIKIGQEIGTENIVAILIYCNYTDLQAKFSETFRRMQDDDTDEMIVDRHCHNYYWLGRCVRLLSLFRTSER